jgi:hypothetical protein
MDSPSFAPMATGPEFCVLVVWPDGSKSRIDHFASSQDAQRWIDREAANWLRARLRPSQAQADSATGAVAFGGARIRTLRAA